MAENFYMKRYRSFFFILIFLFLAGCAPLWVSRIPVSFERPRQCQELLDRLDEAVEKAGVKDASSFSIPGFPHLRTNRFLSALKNALKDDEKRKQWSLLMRGLDLDSRKKEIENLPDEKVLSLMAKDAAVPDRAVHSFLHGYSFHRQHATEGSPCR